MSVRSLVLLLVLAALFTQNSVFAQSSSVEVRDLNLVGAVVERGVEFTATGTVVVDSRNGAIVSLLSGDVALLESPDLKYGELKYNGQDYQLVWDRRGTYEFSIRFLAKVNESQGIRSVAFKFLTAPIRTFELAGVPVDSELLVANAAKPTKRGEMWEAHLSPDSSVSFSWKPAKSDSDRELFYSSDITSVTAVAAGMIKQNQKIDLQVMQGEMNEVSYNLLGPGEISQIEGRDILGWNVERLAGGSRVLKIRFARPQTEEVVLLAKSQIALPKLPAETGLLQLEPIGATRANGQILLLNDGAVNLGIANSKNLSQVSPAQISLENEERIQLQIDNRQAFGFVYAGTDYELSIRAEDILSEVSVSTLSLYHLSSSEMTIDVEMNLDIREAPLREFSIDLPKGFSVVGIEQNYLSDYSISKQTDGEQQIKMLFASPIMGRQILKIQLEKNGAPIEGPFEMPRVVPLGVKSSRGYVGISTDESLKVTAANQSGLSEMIVSYFPVKDERLQIAYRLREADWSAEIDVVYQESSVQTESFHLFSIGEGVAYGSSIATYEISGAPIQELAIRLPEEYENVELSGANVRDWQEESGVYTIRLHAPVSGTYSLLATYETRLNQGDEAVSFAGAEPQGVQSERGYVVFVSPNQVVVTPEPIAPPLLKLEAQELPPEYLIMLDAPIVASYHYASRPFELLAQVNSLNREHSIDQIVELANIETSLSKTGEALTVANFALKSKNASHFTIRLPEGARLWKVSVNDQEPIPARVGQRILVPLGESVRDLSQRISIKYSTQHTPDEVNRLETLKVEAPILLTRWIVSSEGGRAIEFHSGSVTPVEIEQLENSYGSPGSASLFVVGDRDFSKGMFRYSAVVLIALIMVYLVSRSDDSNSRPWWVVPFGVVVAVVGVGVSIVFASRLWNVEEVSQLSQIRMMDTVLSPLDSLFADITNIEILAASNSGESGWVLALLILALSPAISWVAGRLFRISIAVHVSIVVHGICAISILFLEQGLPLLVLFGASIAFVPLLSVGVKMLVSKFRTGYSVRGGATATGALLLMLVLAPFENRLEAQTEPYQIESKYLQEKPVTVKAKVSEEVARVNVSFEWEAKADERLPILSNPAVITSLDIPDGSVRLIQEFVSGSLVYFLEASKSGNHEIVFDYETAVGVSGTVWSFNLRSIPSLIYEATVEFERANCEAFSASAVGVDYIADVPKGNTIARIRLKPMSSLSISCRPRSRDTRLEKTVFYTEVVNNYVPHAGTIEGEHMATLRIAQGQLREISVDVPEGMTITDASADWLDSWRYDPAKNRLELVAANPLTGQPKFSFWSQGKAGALPYSATTRVVSFPDASSETGWIGISLSNDIQLDGVDAGQSLAAVSISDFPSIAAVRENASVAKRELRRAYRYSDRGVELGISLSKVEPEIRVASEEETTLGEDRVVHSATLVTRITRAGIFQLRIVIPDDMEIENVSGKEVSHWTESRENGHKIATLHLNARTLGETTQYVTLAGPGIRENPNWTPPSVRVLGASKQRGQLILSPELGLRIDTIDRVGVSQIDPIEANISDRTKVAFRLLENDWKLVLDVQPVDAWVECRMLQDVTRKAGIAETSAQFRYSIKNAGVKQLRLKLPEGAIGVRFQGQHIANFQQTVSDDSEWEINLDRRVIGDYRLSLEYESIVSADTDVASISGIQSLGTQLQESYLSVRAKQRLSLKPIALPSSLAPIEWQQVPASLRQPTQEAADLAFRTIQSEFQLDLSLERLNMAEVLPAEAKSVRLRSLLSETGVILTEAVFNIDSGHKPDLLVRLPEGSHFWSCYVNEQSVWPATKEGSIHVPLMRSSDANTDTVVKLSYLSIAPDELTEKNALSLIGPQCDLPLENIEWSVFVPSSMVVAEWEGTLDPESPLGLQTESFDLNTLLSRDSVALNAQKEKAEKLLELGNTFADRGDPQAARRALESAYELSKFDIDFNEDARVQLDNLKVQQTMVGLTSWRNQAFSSETEGEVSLRVSNEDDQLRFSRAEADQLLTRNSAEENQALSELARRFIAHQNAVLRNPTGLRELFPIHGMGHRFTRRLQAEPWMEMRLDMEIEEVKRGSSSGMILMVVGLVLLAFIRERLFKRG